MKVIGIQKNVSFNYDGTNFQGLNLYTSEEKNGVEGFVTNKFFINKDKPIYKDAIEVKLGDEISFNYNRFGKPETLFIENE